MYLKEFKFTKIWEQKLQTVLQWEHLNLTLLHSEWPKLYGVLAVLSAIGLAEMW